MQFGAFTPQGWRLDLINIDRRDHWPAMLEVAKTIESSGFTSLWVYDHFHTVPVPSQEVTYEAWALMGALAASTESVRLGQMCTCNSYRPPAYLAKVAASIDVISGGRLEMSIGAGWYEHEYLGYGYDFPKASVRIGQLRESVEIMQRMWTEDEVDFDGEYYQLDGAICQPKPVQVPHIPIWVAGGGEQLTLNVAARYASHSNFADSLDEFRHKSGILAGHCRDVGTDFDAITRSVSFDLICAATTEEVEEQLARVRSIAQQFVDGERAEEVVDGYRTSSGTPDQIVDMLRLWQEEGMTYPIIYMPFIAEDTTGLELFGREVIPALA